MVAVAGLLLPVVGWQGTKDPQAAGHNQGAVDLGGHSPVGLQVHAPRVPGPHRPESPRAWRRAGRPAARRRGAVMSCRSGPATSDTYLPLVPTTEARLETGNGWPHSALRPDLCTPLRRALGVSRQQGEGSTTS